MNITTVRTRESVDLANKVLAIYAKGKIKNDELAPAICKKLKISQGQLHSAMGTLKRAGKVTWQVPNIVPKRRVVNLKNGKAMEYREYVPMPKPVPTTTPKKVKTKANKGNGKDVNGGKRKYTKRKSTTDSIKDLNLQGMNSEITLIAHPTAMARFFRELKQ
jgi:hypothetical protein